MSPFGGALNFGYNKNKRTSLVVAFVEPPGRRQHGHRDRQRHYSVEGGTSWMGAFWNHRPLKEADWFRTNVGVATGQITNEITDKDGNLYKANYRNNPVGYVGVGFGNRVKEGFLIGFDMGALFTPGPQVSGADPDTVAAIEDHFLFGPVLPNGQLTLGWGF